MFYLVRHKRRVKTEDWPPGQVISTGTLTILILLHYNYYIDLI